MEQQLATCIEQLDRGATFSLITECEPFTAINDYGYELGTSDGEGVGLIIGIITGIAIVGIIAAVVLRTD